MSSWVDKAQSPKPPTPQCEVVDYYSSDSSSMSLKQVVQSETKVESFQTIVMPVITIGTSNWKDEMAAMKAMLEKLVKENEEKEGHIKMQEQKITRLTKKLEKWPAQSFMQN